MFHKPTKTIAEIGEARNLSSVEKADGYRKFSPKEIRHIGEITSEVISSEGVHKVAKLKPTPTPPAVEMNTVAGYDGTESYVLAATTGTGVVTPVEFEESSPSYEAVRAEMGDEAYDWWSGVVKDWEALDFPGALEAAAAGIFETDRNSVKRRNREEMRLDVACRTAGADPPPELIEGRAHGVPPPGCKCLTLPTNCIRGASHDRAFRDELDRLHLECDVCPIESKLNLNELKLVCSECSRPEYGAWVFYFLAHGVRFMSLDGITSVPRTHSNNVGIDTEEEIDRLELALRAQVDEDKGKWWTEELAKEIGLEFTPYPPITLMSFLVEHNGKFRLVNNGSAPKGQSINEYCPDSIVRYVVINDLIRMWKEAREKYAGEILHLWKVDLKDMFRQIHLHKLVIGLCGFETPSGRVGVLTRMPMGLKPSCLYANALTGVLQEWIRRRGHKSERITDDFFGIGTQAQAEAAYLALEHLLESCGLVMSYGVGKSSGGAVPAVDVKGIWCDALTDRIERMDRKTEELNQQLDLAMSSRRRTKHDLQRLGGLCAQEVELSPAGRTWLRDLFGPIAGVEKQQHHCNTGKSATRFNAAVAMFKRLAACKGRSIADPITRGSIGPVHLQFDAAGESDIAGMFFNGEAVLLPMQEVNTIGPKELRTVLKGLRLIAPQLAHMTVVVGTDSTNTRDWINNRTAKNRADISLQMLQELFDLCAKYSIEISAARIPTKWNVIADGLSRLGTAGAEAQIEKGLAEWGAAFPRLDLDPIDRSRATSLGRLNEAFGW